MPYDFLREEVSFTLFVRALPLVERFLLKACHLTELALDLKHFCDNLTVRVWLRVRKINSVVFVGHLQLEVHLIEEALTKYKSLLIAFSIDDDTKVVFVDII